MSYLCTFSHVAGNVTNTPPNNTARFIGDSNVAPEVQDDSTLASSAHSSHGQLKFDVKPMQPQD